MFSYIEAIVYVALLPECVFIREERSSLMRLCSEKWPSGEMESRRTSNPKIVGSNPARVVLFFAFFSTNYFYLLELFYIKSSP